MAPNLSPPQGYVTCRTALSSEMVRQLVNVIGIVTDFKVPEQTRGSDFTCVFNLVDISLSGAESLRVRMFKPRELLPEINGVGDIVVLRGVRIDQNPHGHFAMANRDTRNSEVVLISKNSIPHPPLRDKYLCSGGDIVSHVRLPARAKPLSQIEQCYAMDLHDAMPNAQPPTRSFDSPNRKSGDHLSTMHTLNPRDAYRPPHVQQNMARGPTKKFRLVKDVCDRDFADMLVKIVKKYAKAPYDVELYVTDYTENSLLFLRSHPDDDPRAREGDPYNYSRSATQSWKGPYGYLVLQVKLFSPHAEAAYYNFKEGDIVFLSNVCIKLAPNAKLEGVMRTDQKFHEKVCIDKPRSMNGLIDQLLQREEEYERKESERGLPKTEKRHKAKRKKDQKERQKALTNNSISLPSAPTHTLPPKAPMVDTLSLQEGSQQEPKNHSEDTAYSLSKSNNPHIRCQYEDMRLSTLSDILNAPERQIKTPEGIQVTLPFLNAKWRARVRVVDFSPRELEDFARCFDTEDVTSAGLPDPYDTDPSSLPNNGWEWAFYLLVEDAKPPKGEKPTQMPLLVNNHRGQGLLKMDACNLRSNSKALHELREKLFILWGGLEEEKTRNTAKRRKLSEDAEEQPQELNKPFECCIEEYGFEVDGEWKPSRHLFGTTIMWP